jgi:beta-1,4-mannosyl-glycoprotein beta-1,4-N-acetylglucosaminyltransferase
MKTRLFDCFTFFNEFDLLEVRLNELAPVVSHFVIAESSVTFQGAPKPLYFQENRDRFAQFADRIRHVVVTDMPAGAREIDHWRREHHQRNALLRAIGDAGPNDYVMLSDVDEIPRAGAVRTITEAGLDGPVVHCFELAMFRFFINLREGTPWLRSSPRLTRRCYIRSLQALRNIKPPVGNPLHSGWRWLKGSLEMGMPIRRRVVHDGGWHFTSLGGAAAYAEKLRSFSHVEPERRASPASSMIEVAADRIEQALQDNRDQVVPIDDSFPSYIVSNPDRFRPFILPYPERA